MTFVRAHLRAASVLAVAWALLVPLAPGVGAVESQPLHPARALALPAASQDAEPRTKPERFRYVHTQVFTVPGVGSLAVGMPNRRTIKSQRLDEGSDTWTRPRVLFRARGITCGEIAGRASAGGVALVALCDKPYYDDQAPVHTQALVTGDLRQFDRRTLPGEAYYDPAISPDGSYAAWLAGGIGDFVRWNDETGFTNLRKTDYGNDSYGETVTVTDDGTVSVLGVERVGKRTCEVGVHDRTVAGERSSSVVEGIDPGCAEGTLSNVDAFTVDGFAGTTAREDRFEISREDAESPWRLTKVLPTDAPGLETYPGRIKNVIPAQFSDAAGLPLLAIGSPDRQRIFVQAYDDETQAWGAPREVYDHGFPGCASPGYNRAEPLLVHQLSFNCYPNQRADGNYPPGAGTIGDKPRGKVRALLSPDGEQWRMIPINRRPIGISSNRALVAVFNRSGSTVLSPTGFVDLPQTSTHQCGFVFPVASDEVLRFHGSSSAGWPHRLQRFDGQQWVTIDRISMPDSPRCRKVTADDFTAPTAFYLTGAGRQKAVEVVRTAQGYQVVRARF